MARRIKTLSEASRRLEGRYLAVGQTIQIREAKPVPACAFVHGLNWLVQQEGPSLRVSQADALAQSINHHLPLD
jgi:hypothetical protein